MRACASSIHDAICESLTSLSECTALLLTSSTAASKAVRLEPNGSKGQSAVIGFSNVGFSAPSSGAGASEIMGPPSALATSAIM